MKRPSRRDTRHQRGQALFLVLLAMLLVMAVGAAMINVANLNIDRASENRTDGALLGGARVGMAQGRFLFWDTYQESLPSANRPGEVTMARTWLDDTFGLTDGNTFAGGSAKQVAAFKLTGGNIGGMQIQAEPVFVRVLAERYDEGNNTFVILRSVATVWDTGAGGGMDPLADRTTRLATGLPAHQRVSETVYRIGGTPFEGFQYALLTNAVNCTFCHADFDNADRFYDPGSATGYERVKVASLMEMKVGFNNGGGSDTNIAGTLFVQGNLQDIDGDDLDPASVASLDARPFDSSLVIEENPTGTAGDPDSYFPGAGSFADGNKDASGNYTDRDSNLYKNYPTDPAEQTALAGRLPDEFPPVIPDDNDNRVVDRAEWETHVASGSFTGTVTAGADGAGGPGVIFATDSYTSSTLPDTNNVSGINGVSSGSEKNVILIGTESDPIRLDGNVAIDGDLIIGGVVEGKGLLLARGNIFILGDLRYNDDTSSGSRDFGKALDGNDNMVAYAAGGMIVHGNFLTGSNGADFTGDDPREMSERSFTQNEIGLWNRQELTRSMPYVDADTGWPTSDTRSTTGEDNTATAQRNPQYQDGYEPRFYTVKEHEGLNESDAGKIWLHGASPYGTAGYRSAGSNPNPNDPAGSGSSAQYPYSWLRLQDDNGDGTPDRALWMNHDIQGNAYQDGSTTLEDHLAGMDTGLGTVAGKIKAGAYSTIKMESDFVPIDAMRDLIKDYDTWREGSAEDGKPWRLDGLFYTNNGMMFMSRSGRYGGTADNAAGFIEFNGSVVSADTGILAGTHLQLNYDVRTARHLEITDDRSVELTVVSSREGH